MRHPDDLQDPARLMGLFEFIAGNGVKLSREAEDQIREVLPALEALPARLALVPVRPRQR